MSSEIVSASRFARARSESCDLGERWFTMKSVAAAIATVATAMPIKSFAFIIVWF
jgi:hypothetical protein